MSNHFNRNIIGGVDEVCVVTLNGLSPLWVSMCLCSQLWLVDGVLYTLQPFHRHTNTCVADTQIVNTQHKFCSDQTTYLKETSMVIGFGPEVTSTRFQVHLVETECEQNLEPMF